MRISRVYKGKKEETEDIILYETSVDIYVNSKPLVNIICLAKDLKELSIGFLFSIGIINSVEDIKVIKVNELENSIFIELDNNIGFNLEELDLSPVSRVIDTTCGIPSPWRNMIKETLEKSIIKDNITSKDSITIKASTIFAAIKQMQINTPLYRETGGCHGAAIFDVKGNMLSVKEDIGRHNAIDKVIGDMLLKHYKFEDVFLTSTGRLTGDSVLKAIRAKIPIVASLSAAIESGVRLAFGYGVTLIGFARGTRMNIYTHPNKIEL